MKRIAVLVSGGGTNLQALIDAEKKGIIKSGKITLVISNNPQAYALKRAVDNGIKTAVIDHKQYPTRLAFDMQVKKCLEENGIDFIVLAGFMRILTEEFVKALPQKIINVHPSLIPSFCGDGFYGLKVHEAVLARGVKLTGATVHYVNEITDGGEILLQKSIEVLPNDIPQTLQKRVMEQCEWIILPQAVEKVCSENVHKGGAMKQIQDLLTNNSYPGRGIVIGTDPTGETSIIAYFIMGRSTNSRNRIFVTEGEGLKTQAFDPAKMVDPSLVIYYPVRTLGDTTIVTNGDQTDTIYFALQTGGTFESALRTRKYEPDLPNCTPRISGILHGDGRYKLSILKSADGNPDYDRRQFFEYEAEKGTGHFIHTYRCDGDPIPSFEGEPVSVTLEGDIDSLTQTLWESLNEDNKVSLFVQYINRRTGKIETRIINKNK